MKPKKIIEERERGRKRIGGKEGGLSLNGMHWHNSIAVNLNPDHVAIIFIFIFIFKCIL